MAAKYALSNFTKIRCYDTYFLIQKRFFSIDQTKLNFKRRLADYLGSEVSMNQMKFFFPQKPIKNILQTETQDQENEEKNSGFLFSEIPPLYHFVEVDAPPVSLQEIFVDGCRVLDDFLHDRPLERQSKLAVDALESFYANRCIHEKSLRNLRNPEIAKSETAVMSLLAVHFLTQLIPRPNNYYLDKYASFNTSVCPCGCDQPLQFGMTSVGNMELFYGSPDIVLFTNGENVFNPDGMNSSVFLTKKGSHLFNSAYEDGDALEDEDLSINEVIERSYFDEDDTEKILRQAIAMSFCYKKQLQKGCTVKRRNKESTMLPSCGITSSAYNIALYDSTNDILLLSDDTESDLKLFEEDESIRFSAMVNLWLVINHPLFCAGLWKEAIEQFKGSCDIKSYIGDKDLQELINKSRWFFTLEKKVSPKKTTKSLTEIVRRPDSRIPEWKASQHFKD